MAGATTTVLFLRISRCAHSLHTQQRLASSCTVCISSAKTHTHIHTVSLKKTHLFIYSFNRSSFLFFFTFINHLIVLYPQKNITNRQINISNCLFFRAVCKQSNYFSEKAQDRKAQGKHLKTVIGH